MSFTNFKDIAKSKNQIITFIHVASGKSVFFPALLTEYSDNYSVQWGNEQIFGRNDPVKPYQSTTRQLQVGFDVLSHNLENAKANLFKITTLVKMMYPMYSPSLNDNTDGLGRTIKAPPLLRIKFVNMIQSADGNGSLLGCIEGFNYAPNKEPGYFIEKEGSIFPKHVNISFRFTPQHESPLGWSSEESEFLTDNFPYSAEPSRVSDVPQGDSPSIELARQQRLLNVT